MRINQEGFYNIKAHAPKCETRGPKGPHATWHLYVIGKFGKSDPLRAHIGDASAIPHLLAVVSW